MMRFLKQFLLCIVLTCIAVMVLPIIAKAETIEDHYGNVYEFDPYNWNDYSVLPPFLRTTYVLSNNPILRTAKIRRYIGMIPIPIVCCRIPKAPA